MDGDGGQETGFLETTPRRSPDSATLAPHRRVAPLPQTHYPAWLLLLWIPVRTPYKPLGYRHIIEWLVRKPGAFENYRYQEDLFPTSRFRMAYDALKETAPSRYTKEYLKLLQLAAEEGEVQVDEALRDLLEGNAEAVITLESIRELLAKLDTIPPVTMVQVAPVDLASFDQLCMAVRQ
jgi:hypothetical protein